MEFALEARIPQTQQMPQTGALWHSTDHRHRFPMVKQLPNHAEKFSSN